MNDNLQTSFEEKEPILLSDNLSRPRKKRKLNLSQTIGPGLLMAGAAVGVSHLVQSTRAGANFGLQLLPLIVLVNIAKYPFFEIGHRFTASTGKSLLDGYNCLGKNYLRLFLLLNLFVSVATTAGVLFVTASIGAELINYNNTFHLSFFILVACLVILSQGSYGGLDIIMKIIMCILVFTTILTLSLAIKIGGQRALMSSPDSPWTVSNLPFLLALMGWMPAPIELSVWQSLWFKERDHKKNYKTSLTEAKIDFNLGYFLTLSLALSFLGLGACVMFQVSSGFPSSGVDFAQTFINMYTQSIGEWLRPFITAASFTAMFSTCLTVIDAYPRSLSEGLVILTRKKEKKSRTNYWIFMTIILITSLIVMSFFGKNLKNIVDYATIISFIAAPIFAFLNFKLIYSKFTPKKYQPNIYFKALSLFGLSFMTLFLILFLLTLF
tara:strand:+ start:792 stop:2105 length:1314 start_codon:yes stop_codon:yes gene_type:complete